MMELQITGRHVEITEAIRSYIEKKIKKLEHFSHRIISVHVILQIQRFSQIVEITVRGKDLDLIVKESAESMYGAFDEALDRAAIAVERHEEKRKGRKRENRKARERLKQRASKQLARGSDDAFKS
jgi:putative sigma-54 modulation protein